MSAAYLRRRRDQRKLATVFYCSLAGLVMGSGFVVGPFRHIHHPLTILDILLFLCGFSLAAILWYVIIPYRRPLITLYKNDIEWRYHKYLSNLYYRDIESCDLRREIYKGVSFVLMKINPKECVKVKTWLNKPMLEVGIPAADIAGLVGAQSGRPAS